MEEESKNLDKNRKIDFSGLDAKLEELDSNAFILAERECRMSADPTPDIMYSSAFRARIAAAALKVSYEDVCKLKLPEYTALISRVLSFLLKTLGETVIQRSD